MSISKLSLQTAIDDAEWAQLRQRWPSADYVHRQLEVDSPFLTGRHQQLFSDHRRAEICYVAYETSPDEGLLLHLKTIYPSDAYRLPTGGVQPGEAVWDTLLREITEETGLTVGAEENEAHVRDMLGVLSYQFVHASLSRSFEFATYYYLVEFPAGAELMPQDASERINGWQWRRPDEMSAVAETLDTVGQRTPYWGDWGRFRALGHRYVFERLAKH